MGKQNILVTGGAGYIGSHTVLELLSRDYNVVVVDNLSNSSRESLTRVEKLAGKRVQFYKADLLDPESLNGIFEQNEIAGVIHFAGLKAVGESVTIPLAYYKNNITGTLNLLESMKRKGVKKIVFSSSATVYGEPEKVPITEDFPTAATNPYGRTKLMIEKILQDLHASDDTWSIGVLRYFNPVGAHESGQIGEDPGGIPNNLMPYISQVAIGRRAKLPVYGDDYDTPDGTGIRDYIHVVDLARGHLSALNYLDREAGLLIVNLGTGRGHSVLDLVKAFEAASGKKVAYEVLDRRPGDISTCYADTSRALDLLGWCAERGIREMCEDTWRWQSQNPEGYKN